MLLNDIAPRTLPTRVVSNDDSHAEHNMTFRRPEFHRASALAATCACIIVPSIVGSQSAPNRPAPTRIEVAPNIYLFQTQRYGDAGLDGNSVVIVSNDGVLVFDANGTPAAATAVLAEIRKLTTQPVKYLVLSHWHWDHWYGAEIYRKAFPSAQVIAHEGARALMAGPAEEFNRPFIETQFPEHLKELDAQLTKARESAAPDSAVAALRDHIVLDRWFLDQKKNASLTIPTRTYTDSLPLMLGGRRIVLRHVDRAITPGDTFLWLEDGKIAIVADLLINPMTYGLFCYPSGWLRTLETIDALNPAVIVPGHGTPMRDKVRLSATMQLIRREREIAAALKRDGKSVAETKAAILADSGVLALRETLTGGNVAYREPFRTYLVDWVVPRIYQEIDGTLDNSIPKAP